MSSVAALSISLVWKYELWVDYWLTGYKIVQRLPSHVSICWQRGRLDIEGLLANNQSVANWKLSANLVAIA
jgi:hypothetical protein